MKFTLATAVAPTLRQALVRAIQAKSALSAGYDGDTSEQEMDRREREEFSARGALYEAFAEHGIDPVLANQIGDVL